MTLRLLPAPTAPGATDDGDGDPGVVVCLTCRLDFDHFHRPGEPGYFAGEHNRLWHRGNPVAFVTTVDPAGSLGGDAA